MPLVMINCYSLYCIIVLLLLKKDKTYFKKINKSHFSILAAFLSFLLFFSLRDIMPPCRVLIRVFVYISMHFGWRLRNFVQEREGCGDGAPHHMHRSIVDHHSAIVGNIVIKTFILIIQNTHLVNGLRLDLCGSWTIIRMGHQQIQFGGGQNNA